MNSKTGMRESIDRRVTEAMDEYVGTTTNLVSFIKGLEVRGLRIVSEESLLPNRDDLAFAVVEAARRASDKRTLMDGGFWISKREMRYIDNALAEYDEGLPTADDVRGVL